MGVYRPVVNIAGAAGKLSASDNGTAPHYAARAWVNFNGTGTPAIRASGNVTSITDNGTGDYTVNFTTALPDVNYSAHITTGQTSGAGFGRTGSSGGLYSTTQLQVNTINSSGTIADAAAVCVAIFR